MLTWFGMFGLMMGEGPGPAILGPLGPKLLPGWLMPSAMSALSMLSLDGPGDIEGFGCGPPPGGPPGCGCCCWG